MTKREKKSFKPDFKSLIKRKQEAVKEVEIVNVKRATDQYHARRVTQMVVKGLSYDQISRRLGISTQEAHRITKEVVARWRNDEAMESVELKAIMQKQIDSVLALAMHEAFPHPINDPSTGKPILVKVCTCEGDTCDIKDHTRALMSTPSKHWADMVISILDRKAKLLGLDAAQKLEEQKVDILNRIYKGVDSGVIDKL